MIRIFTFFLAILLHGLSISARAQNQPDIRTFFLEGTPPDSHQKLTDGLRDSALELELYISRFPLILNLITPFPHGKVGDLLNDPDLPQNLDQDPTFLSLAAQASEKASPLSQEEIQAFKDRDYLSLSLPLKTELFKWIHLNKIPTFAENRKIPGFVMRTEIPLRWKKDVVFLGKSYQADRWYRVDISALLGNTLLEYVSPLEISQINGVEFHFRSREYAAGDLLREVWTLFNGVNGKKIKNYGTHVHVVAPIPFKALQCDPKIVAAMVTEYWRRLNIYDELRSVSHFQPLSKVTEGDMCFWSPHEAESLPEIFQYFISLAGSGNNPRERERLSPGDHFKLAHVGLWGHDKYDEEGEGDARKEKKNGPSNLLMGFEFRNLLRWDPNKKELVQILNLVQRNMIEGNFGTVSKDFIGKQIIPKNPGALKARMKNDLKKKWQESSYMGPEISLPEKFRGKHENIVRLINEVMKTQQKALEFKILFFDWAKDPLVSSDQRFLRKVQKAQETGLADLFEFISRTPPEKTLNYWPVVSTTFTQSFIRESGLLGFFKKNIGDSSYLPPQQEWCSIQ